MPGLHHQSANRSAQLFKTVSFRVLEAKSKKDAIRQARVALEMLNGGSNLPQRPKPANEGRVHLQEVDRGYFEFTPDGLVGTSLEGCSIWVDGESTRQEAEAVASEFIEWLHAQAPAQTEQAELKIA